MDEPLHCLVEIPKGSHNKSEWEPELGGIKLEESRERWRETRS